MFHANPPVVDSYQDDDYACVTVTMGQFTCDLTIPEANSLIAELHLAISSII